MYCIIILGLLCRFAGAAEAPWLGRVKWRVMIAFTLFQAVYCGIVYGITWIPASCFIHILPEGDKNDFVFGLSHSTMNSAWCLRQAAGERIILQSLEDLTELEKCSY